MRNGTCIAFCNQKVDVNTERSTSLSTVPIANCISSHSPKSIRVNKYMIIISSDYMKAGNNTMIGDDNLLLMKLSKVTDVHMLCRCTYAKYNCT